MAIFARKKKVDEADEVSVAEHQEAREKYSLALSTIDENIQAIRESRMKARRIFCQFELVEAKKV